MCTVSMVSDFYRDQWQKIPYVNPSWPPPIITVDPIPIISDKEFADFLELYRRAKEYDKKNNQPDCEMKEKVNRIIELLEKAGHKWNPND